MVPVGIPWGLVVLGQGLPTSVPTGRAISDWTASPITDSDLAFEPKWGIESPSTTKFDFNYTGGREQLLRLYDKGTRRQWIGSDRLDWSIDVDLTNPVGMSDELLPIFGTKWWDDMNDERKGEFRRHVAAGDR